MTRVLLLGCRGGVWNDRPPAVGLCRDRSPHQL